MATLTYGEHQFDTEKLPASSVTALLAAGLAHNLGNVVASGVVGDIRKAINPEKPSDVTTEAVKAWRKANEEAVAEFASARFTAQVKAIADGTLGVHAPRGPSAAADPLAAEMRKIAKEQISTILVAGGMKFPGMKDKKPLTVTLKGKPFTGDELIVNRLNAEYPTNNRTAIEAEAKRNIEARKRATAKLAEAGVDSL